MKKPGAGFARFPHPGGKGAERTGHLLGPEIKYSFPLLRRLLLHRCTQSGVHCCCRVLLRTVRKLGARFPELSGIEQLQPTPEGRIILLGRGGKGKGLKDGNRFLAAHHPDPAHFPAMELTA